MDANLVLNIGTVLLTPIFLQQISSTVELKDNATSMLKVTYHSQCLNASGSEKKTNKCGNIKVSDIVSRR